MAAEGGQKISSLELSRSRTRCFWCIRLFDLYFQISFDSIQCHEVQILRVTVCFQIIESELNHQSSIVLRQEISDEFICWVSLSDQFWINISFALERRSTYESKLRNVPQKMFSAGSFVDFHFGSSSDSNPFDFSVVFKLLNQDSQLLSHTSGFGRVHCFTPD